MGRHFDELTNHGNWVCLATYTAHSKWPVAGVTVLSSPLLDSAIRMNLQKILIKSRAKCG
jgi:hypothetical protein